ncbi:hypothetical protein DFJ58DRAFT_770461 [Suillus subalutaceus]|uniref:uncharacterized protein n=1 Tax=Suillus subalutaceus TaxID=48586 RepID=UPI001B87E2D7|nr:uncharacterized protein DFJ58DRAFT_770461 [Suillus subalutaceus]KAG1865831.1 hypothetical protein DFJ58DRAFT_770461 [Suillus subalutaceus]
MAVDSGPSSRPLHSKVAFGADSGQYNVPSPPLVGYIVSLLYLKLASSDGYEIVAIPRVLNIQVPRSMEQTLANANSVIYSLTSACGVCQGLFLVTTYSLTAGVPGKTYCTTAFTQLYPTTIPTGTAVPNWAYLDVVVHEVSQLSYPKFLGSAHNTSTTPLSVAHPPRPRVQGLQRPLRRARDIGATAGGVVGGIVGVWSHRRRRRFRRGVLSRFQPTPNDAASTIPPTRALFPPPLFSTLQTTTSSFNQTFHSRSRPGQYNGVPEF